MTKFKARPTVYKGIQMRSRLEAGFAAWLDSQGLTWEYEPCAFATEGGQYLPDFRVKGLAILGYQSLIYVEVKPDSYLAKASVDYPAGQIFIEEIELQTQIIKASEPDADVCLVTPSGAYWSVGGRLYPARFVFGEPGTPMILAMLMAPPWDGEYWKPQAAAREVPKWVPPAAPEPEFQEPGSLERTMGRIAALYKAYGRESADFEAALAQVKDDASLGSLLMIAIDIGTQMARIEANADPESGEEPQDWPSAEQYLDSTIEYGQEAEQQIAERTRTAGP